MEDGGWRTEDGGWRLEVRGGRREERGGRISSVEATPPEGWSGFQKRY